MRGATLPAIINAKAREGHEQAIATRERLEQDNPEVTTTYRGDLASSLRRRGLIRLDRGDRAGAADDRRRALEIRDALPSSTGEDWFESACCHAALAALAGREGGGVSTGETSTEGDRAISLLKRAIGRGFRSYVRFRQESALNPLRGRPDFRLLMMDLAMPAEPFAR